MHVPTHRNTLAGVLFVLGFVLLASLALSSTTWAAPNAQGTVPTPPKPTAQATSQNKGGGKGGNNGGGSQNNGGNAGAAPTATAAPGNGTVCAIGDNGAQCTAGDLSIVVGAGAAPAGSALTIEGPFGQPPCPDSPAGSVFLNRCYRYTWIGTNAQALPAISGPVQYCFTYGAEQVAAANNKPESMLIGFATADGKWSVVKPTIDTNAQRVCATTNQLIGWSALFAPAPGTNVLPTVGGSGFNVWMLPLAILGTVMMLAAWRLYRQTVI